MKASTDTIVAIATPPGQGGVGIVRVSGSLAKDIALRISGLSTLTPRAAFFVKFHDANEIVLDEGILLYFQNPHSFTGEDIVELQAHGSPIVLDQLVQTAIHHGARLAEPGEFSKRAFLNKKIDLAQAEAIADLIAATSEQAARSAVRSLQGDFSKRIQALQEKLTLLRMQIEAMIDFPEEEIDFLADPKVADLLQKTIDEVLSVKNTAKQGALLQSGLRVAIVGKPNAGKSSLLNYLSGREAAIVTDIPGTTRDVLRESIQIDGMPLHLVDTAGLRETDDVVEKEGVRRAQVEMAQADVVLEVVDIAESEAERQRERKIISTQKLSVSESEDKVNSEAERERERKIISTQKLSVSESEDKVNSEAERQRERKYDYVSSLAPASREERGEIFVSSDSTRAPASRLIVRNKIDLIGESPSSNNNIISLSIKQNLGMDLLIDAIKKLAGFQSNETDGFIARRRHVDAIERAYQALLKGQEALLYHRAGELLAEELRQAQCALSEITGEFSADDLLGEIFSRFCIGK